MRIIAIIPARFNSSRFPGKPLVNIEGKSMIQRVYERVSEVKELSRVVVATDDARIMEHCKIIEADAVLTDTTHPSGTDRVAQVAKELEDIDIVINVQGDEPFIRKEQIEMLIRLFELPETKIASLVTKITDSEEINDPNVVKASFDRNFLAKAFSRKSLGMGLRFGDEVEYFKHLGIYAFRREVLIELTKLPQSDSEIQERLEQLRWMDHGYSIQLAVSPFDSYSIDTPDDLKKIPKEWMTE